MKHFILTLNDNNNNNRKSLKGADLKQKRAVLITDYSLQITSTLHTVNTHGLVAFQVSVVWFHLRLFRTGTASFSVSAAVVVASTAAHLVPTAAATFPSIYSALSSSASCCRTFLQALLLLVLLE